MFIHKPYEFEKLEQITHPNGIRFYKTPKGNEYHSVTTVLSHMLSKQALIDWRERIGDEEADRILKFAGARGTHVHAVCEEHLMKYLQGNEIQEKKLPPEVLDPFMKIKKVVDKNIKIVNNTEFQVYSDRMKTAGTCDVLCHFDGVPSVVDFKTSMKYKKEEWIDKYFYQVTCYALMVYEIHKIVIPRIVIIIGTDGVENAQVFVKETKNYVKETLNIFQNFHNLSSDLLPST